MLRFFKKNLNCIFGSLGVQKNLCEILKKIVRVSPLWKTTKIWKKNFLIFFSPWFSFGLPKMHLRSFFEKSQLKFESLLFPSGEFWNLHPLFFKEVKLENMLPIGRVGVGLSLSEPTNLKHYQYLPHLPYTYLQ